MGSQNPSKCNFGDLRHFQFFQSEAKSFNTEIIAVLSIFEEKNQIERLFPKKYLPKKSI
jgi:hypothetical protein